MAIELAQTIDDAHGLLRRGTRHLDVFLDLLLVVEVFRPGQQQFIKPQNLRQNVVEIVGDTTRHLRQSPQPLLLHNLLLRFAQFRHCAGKLARTVAEGLLGLFTGGDVVHTEQEHGSFWTMDQSRISFTQEFAAVGTQELKLPAHFVHRRLGRRLGRRLVHTRERRAATRDIAR